MICSRCHQEGEAQPYNNRGIRGYRSICKTCHKKGIAGNLSVLRARNMARLTEAKNKPCMDCGGSFPAVCMDFDHVRGNKVGNISTMAGQALSPERIEAEIAKCDVVCSNCHRIRTDARRAHGRRKAA